jgi:hypothetical protein
MQVQRLMSALCLMAAALCWIVSPASAADGDPWKVSKSSGEVWVTRGEMQRVALTSDTALSPGDTIRTGRTGRVQLTRGEESIVISPNSEIGIPAPSKDGFPTTIAQKAGSILLEVEKRNVQHFEVETPYLAAVVKGTQFRVTVDRKGAHVDVSRGQVQVSDFKTGQNVVVLPGQSAGVLAHGAAGLQLKGSGTFNAIEQGKPRATGLRALSVPKGGLHAPRLGAKDAPRGSASKATLHGAAGKAFARADSAGKERGLAVHRTANGSIRIDAALGEVKLDINKVTSGLAHGAGDSAVATRKDANGSDGPKSSGGDSASASSGSSSSASSSSSSAASGGSSGSVGGSVGGAVGGTVGAVASTVSGVSSTVSGVTSTATSTVSSVVSGATSTVSSVISSVTSNGCANGKGKKLGLVC